MNGARYHRQSILPQVGETGQAKLAAAGAVVVGCGALGSNIAQQLARAGVGLIRLVDRDLVEWSNLQRQVLFDEADARSAAPKAVASATKLSAVNSDIVIEPVVMDIDSGNIASLLAPAGGRKIDVILDGTDNAEIRYLLNDLAVREDVPWIYGGVVGVEGRVMPVLPARGPCLRCLYEKPPIPGALPTCDVAGVLGPAAAMVGAMQATAAMRVLIDGDGKNDGALSMGMISFNAWSGRFHRLSLDDAKRDGCPCCGQRRFEFLDSPRASGSATLCGRDAVQVRPANPQSRLDLSDLADRLDSAGPVERNRFFIRLHPTGDVETLTIFPDARVIVTGTRDPARARTLVARWIGS